MNMHFCIIADCQVEIDGAGEETRIEVDNGFISYIVDCTKSFEAGIISASTMVRNLSAASVLQYVLMKLSGVAFRKESAASLNNSESYSAIQKLTSNLCISYFNGKKKTKLPSQENFPHPLMARVSSLLFFWVSL